MREHAQNVKKTDFDKLLECAAPTRWSKYTVLILQKGTPIKIFLKHSLTGTFTGNKGNIVWSHLLESKFRDTLSSVTYIRTIVDVTLFMQV